MKLSRRELLRLGAMAGAGAMFLPKKFAFAQSSPTLTPFVDALPIPPVLTPGAATVDVHMRQFRQKLHRDLAPTKLWGYNGTYVGPTFETRTGSPISVQWLNDLPATHFLPIDHTIHGAEANVPDVRTVVHLHGAKVLPDSDGYPEAWFTNGFAQTGPDFTRRVYHYPNDQAAMQLWYHDHALGITRLNVFAGLAGMYFVRDAQEDALRIPKGRYEVPLLIQDRFFNPDGSLAYPVQDPTVAPPIPPVWIPEFFGDTALVNGKVFPFLEVEPRRYRFRLLNACNARFLHLTLGNSRDALETLHFFQIGADQGFLPRPLEQADLLVAPAERFDLVIDFTGKAGKSFTLKNDAPSPFPGGGGADLPQIMQFRVSKPLASQDHALPAQLVPVPLLEAEDAARTRQLVLAEFDDPTTGDPIEGMLGTTSLGGLHWSSRVTEDPHVGDTEVWELYNTTTDGHPIHVHLVRFQVLNRQKFDLNRYQSTGEIRFLAPPEAPAANERPAWKDVVKAFPGDPSAGVGVVTRIIQK
ncbi:MAG TPA: multicopper oxidase domain-containing protein, partial [Thermoanaerobaculia bacterium]|nr:multicopper oxidase domain-containing protein [Thermoanaerobaculia bacterium]